MRLYLTFLAPTAVDSGSVTRVGSAGKRKPVPNAICASHSGVSGRRDTERFDQPEARTHIIAFAV